MNHPARPMTVTAGALLSLASGVVLFGFGSWFAISVAKEPVTNDTHVPHFLPAVAALMLCLPFIACYLICGVVLLSSGPKGKANSRVAITVATAILLIPSLTSLLSRPDLLHLTLLLPASATLLLWYPATTAHLAGRS